MIPKIIHQTWVGPNPMPEQHRVWSQTIRDHHPGWEYRLWGESDIDDFGCRDLMDRCNSQSGRSDVLRLMAVYKHGGVYFDTDIECRRNLELLLPQVGAFAALERGTIVCNAFFGAEPGHHWLKRQIDLLPDFVDRLPPWGPLLATELWRELTLLPTRLIYPFLWDQPIEVGPDAYLVHYWERTWKAAREGAG
jgi:inositol phosphorylceramide mannosyltransferase catalytic subunit